MKSKTVCLAITILCALIIIIDAFFNISIFKILSLMLTEWTVVMGVVAFAAAALALFSLHIKRIMFKRNEWYLSAYLIAIFLVQTTLGIIFGSNSGIFMFAINHMFTPLGATMYSLLALWIASAAYRAFRARSLDATIMLLTAVIVMIGSTSFGAAISPYFADVSRFIQLIPTTAASRGIMIGGGIGAIALGVRILLGIERGHTSASGE